MRAFALQLGDSKLFLGATIVEYSAALELEKALR